MTNEHVIRVPRSDVDDGFAIINITSNGSLPLDLKLEATEGEYPYKLDLKQSQLSRLRSKHGQIDDIEWETVLLSTLLRQRFSGKEAESLEKLEVIALITGDQLVIIFRKNILGITQRLGEISLTRDEDLEISTIDWTSTAIIRSYILEDEVRGLTTKYKEQGEIVKKLNQQLEDLIQAKANHENSLLEKFRELLNAKKLKIRDQQRLLAGAKLDANKASQIQSAQSKVTSRKPTSSCSFKRNAATVATESDSSDVGFEKMAVDGQSPVAVEGEAPATPEKSDLDATEDEDEDLDAAPPPPPARLGKIGGTAKDKVLEKETIVAKPMSPPPRRELPFAAKDRKAEVEFDGVGKVAEAAAGNDMDEAEEEEEDSDDEL